MGRRRWMRLTRRRDAPLLGHDKGQTGRGKKWRFFRPPGRRSWKYFKWNPDLRFREWALNFLQGVQR